MQLTRTTTWGWILALLGACGSTDAGDQANEASDGADESGDDGGTVGDSGTSEGAEPTDPMGDPAVVYWRDIKPIVDARCVACHSADGVAPFPLTTYEEVALYAGAIGPAIASGQMPPWPASSDCNDYLFDPSLDNGQIETITTWIELGVPAGNPADEGAALPLLGDELPRVDLEIAMDEEHVAAPPTGEVDEHRCFLLDWPEAADTHVTGYEVVPGNRKVVHHLVARIVGPDGVADFEAQDEADGAYGWACGAGTGMSGGSGPLLGVWVPGQGASTFPAGTGLPVETGSKVLLNMHYNTVMGDTAPDRTGVKFMLEETVEQVGQSQFITDPMWPIGDNMLIAAGDPDSVHTFDFMLPAIDVTIYATGLHMHTLAEYASLVVEHGDGSTECAVDIPRWDFGWQLGYRLAEPIRVSAGDRVVLTCGYDNTEGNQAVIDGVQQTPRDVTWGEDTYDEMCLGYVYITRD